jgi:2-polyprenyl-3-methyl-5-hydroxy-6-metoxy-1,4-benzoquinol methylase
VAEVLRQEVSGKFARLADVGCGTGSFRSHCSAVCEKYCGVDVVRYDDFPTDAEFLAADLDSARWPLEDNLFDATVSLETIEHLENPRAFFREMTRITRPGGLVIVTTPNQLSFLSKLTLIVKNEFTAFQERPGLYPAHRTALLETDLARIARESGLQGARIAYSNSGRIPGGDLTWPAMFGGRAFSDNVMVIARKPAKSLPGA